jgi:hypothetical protein
VLRKFRVEPTRGHARLRGARELLFSAGMSAADTDRWFVHTDAYLEAVDFPEYLEEPTPRLWTWLMADLILASMAFVALTYIL